MFIKRVDLLILIAIYGEVFVATRGKPPSIVGSPDYELSNSDEATSHDSPLILGARHPPGAEHELGDTPSNGSDLESSYSDPSDSDELASISSSPEDGLSDTPDVQSATSRFFLGARGSQATIHVIGDTHGDENYLFRCLESTTRVEIENSSGKPRVQWAAHMSEAEVWEIVILGDIIDRGSKSRDNLLTLKRLAADRTWGDRLVVLLGNHESLLLERNVDYALEDPNWSMLRRYSDLRAPFGSEGHALISWLCTRPVVHFSHGLWMMHGGFKKSIADRLKQQVKCTSNCGVIVANAINKEAHEFYRTLHESYVSKFFSPTHFDEVSRPPYFLLDDGILWYRGWNSPHCGAGTSRNCEESTMVSNWLGAQAIVVAHTVHPRMTRYCGYPTPVFVVDTHPSECFGTYGIECDFDYKHDMDPKYMEDDYHKTEALPQSLRVTPTKSTYEYAACVERNHRASCTRFEDQRPTGQTQVEVMAQMRRVFGA